MSILVMKTSNHATKDLNVRSFMEYIAARNPNEPEFLQAVQEVAEYIIPYVEQHPQYKEARILERICEPERVIMFRVTWEDDKRRVHINRGYRIQMNSAIGPYKGGLRFHPSVNLSILKFLAFEQVFKNSLTTLPMGGGKGGADFDPKGKSDHEVMRFCQSFMLELQKHIGPDIDIPAGDIGVGAREIGYLFGHYKRIKGYLAGALTGKGLSYGGSHIRQEATGYGVVYFACEMLKTRGESPAGKICVVSGSGNVAQYAVEKLITLGAKVVTLSDSTGYIYDKNGINEEKLQFVFWLKNEKRGRIEEYAQKFGCEFYPGKKPWGVQCDMAFPCATQNELDGEDAIALVSNGCFCISEGANMPCTPEAIEVFQKHGVLYAPGKAANAGGVAVSGLEMTQNATHLPWTREEVDRKLQEIMVKIHQQCEKYGGEGNRINYVKGANIAGFVKVADAMLAYGIT